MKKTVFGALLALALLAPTGGAWSQVCPAVAALPDAERRVAYSPSASTGPFAVSFPILGDSTDYGAWVEVWLNGVMLTPVTQWQLTIPSGTLSTACRPIMNASVTLSVAATGTLQIVGARRPRRTSQFPENAGVSARNLNQVITDLTSQNRETWDKINDVTGRALISQPGNTIGNLPLPSACAGKFLNFDSTGLFPQCSVGPSGIGPGNVAGPGVSIVGHFAVWANTTGTLLADGGAPTAVDVTAAPFNAVANCSTDNSAAFTAAFAAAAAANRPVYIPGAPLCYRYSTTITMTALVPIFGDGMDQSILEYTGAGVGLLIQPALVSAAAAEFRGHWMEGFTIKPSVIGGGTYGIHVELTATDRLYAQFQWNRIRSGQWGTYSVRLNNVIGSTDGFFLGNINGAQFGNSIIGENIGDTITIADTKIHGSAALAFSMISGARGLVLADSSITTSGGLACAPCNGVRIENNHFEIFAGTNFNGGQNAHLSFLDSSNITVKKNRIAKVGAGTKPNDTILFLGTTHDATVDENELALGNNTHVRSTSGTNSITIGPSNAVDVLPFATTLAGSISKYIDYTSTTIIGDTNYQVLCTDRIIVTGAALTANRTITLPASASCPDGLPLTFKDAAGVFGTFGWIITRSGADTIQGATSITVNGIIQSMSLRLLKAAGVWVYPVATLLQGGTGSTTAAGARTNLGLGTAATENITLAGTNAWTGDNSWTCTASGCTSGTFISTNADGVAGPLVQVFRNSASPAAADNIGQFIFTGRDTGGSDVVTYGGLSATVVDATDGSEDGRFNIQTIVAGAQGNRLHVAAGLSVGLTTDLGAGTINALSLIKTGTTTVGALPACAAGLLGARFFVTDNNTALAFAAVITAGGAIQTPVYCDGTVWRQG